MDKAKAIIFGAGKNGENVYKHIKDNYEIVHFVDNNINRWGKDHLGITIISPQELLNYNDAKIYIATIHELDVINQLISMGIEMDRIITFNISLVMESVTEKYKKYEREERLMEEIKKISIGKLLSTIKNGTMNLSSISFIPGSSGVLDFALLRALMLKYNLKTYLEIGTYIGESINIITDIADKCYSISVPESHPCSMKNWCKKYGMQDYSNRLINKSNIVQFLEDSKEFDFGRIQDKIDLYFIDADHSYDGVLNDTRKVFDHKAKDSIVVWHDFKKSRNKLNMDVISAVEDTLSSKEFENIFLFDNNICGIYIPDKYLADFHNMTYFDKNELYTYDLDYHIIVR